MTDEPEVKKLENRIDKLESTIEKMMPSRRDALKMGGAALAGGSLMAGTASAGTNQVGTIGSASQPVDLESEDINNADTVTTQDLVVNGTASGPFGGGIVFEEGDSIQEFNAGVVPVGATDFFDIFNLNTGVDVYGGAVYGKSPSALRITFDSNTVVSFGDSNTFDSGRDASGDTFGVQPIFPMKSVKRIEFQNNSSSSDDYGFQVYTT